MNCPKCNAVLKEGARFCHVCGFDTQSIVNEPEKTEPVVNANPVEAPVYSQPANNLNTNTMEQNQNQGMAPSTNFITRAINIITKPKQEWAVIEKETPNNTSIIMGHVAPWTVFAAICTFIGIGIVGYKVGAFGFYTYFKSIPFGITSAITTLVSGILGVYISALVIDLLAPTFKTQRNFGKAIQLVAYSFTPMWVGGIFSIYHPLAIIGSLFGLYGLYLLYVGMDHTMKQPAEQKVGYFVVSLLVMIVTYFVLGLILGAIMLAFYNPFSYSSYGF